MASKSDKPWRHAPKRSKPHTHLSSAQKTAAKASAKRAHRTYPNLVDNMNASRRK